MVFVNFSDTRTFVQNSQATPETNAENREHGPQNPELQMTSRYVDAFHLATHSNDQVSLHAHPFHEIICCRAAENVEYLVGTERYRLEKGDIILVPPGVSHRPLLPEHMAEPFRRDILWINRDWINLLPGLSPRPSPQTEQPHLLRTTGTKWELIGDVFRTCVRESDQHQPGWEEAVIGNCLQLLVYLYRAIQERTAQPPKAEQPQLLDEVLSYIESHLAEKITLADTARHFWVSQSTISQLFRNKLGVSFHRSITQRRLIAARILIAQDHPLEDVGRQVGFTDYSTFYRAFKQEFGISPRQYRKQLESPDNMPIV